MRLGRVLRKTNIHKQLEIKRKEGNMNSVQKIQEYWDIDGVITALSDAKAEFELYEKTYITCGLGEHNEQSEVEEITLEDFENYIDWLKEKAISEHFEG